MARTASKCGHPSPVRRLLGPDWQLGWLLVAPVFLIIAALLIYPFFDAILLSFQDRFIGKAGHWIGIRNYTDLFTNPNSHFLKAAWNTVAITGGAIVSKFFIGTAMACVLNQQIRAQESLARPDVPAVGGARRRDRLRMAVHVRHLRPDQRRDRPVPPSR